jgi:hypothetical protein
MRRGEGTLTTIADIHTETFPAPPPSNRRSGADVLADLARQELAVARGGEKPAAFDRDLAAQDRQARPGRHFVAFPRRVIGLVQILLADDPPGARIEQDDVGVRADRQCALLRIEAHDARRVRRDEADEIGKAVAAFRHHVRVHQRDARLDPGIAAGGVVDAPALQFDLQRAAHLVGRDRMDRSVVGARPQRLLILGEFERGIGVIHLPTRALVVFGVIEQVLVQGFAVNREAARA